MNSFKITTTLTILVILIHVAHIECRPTESNKTNITGGIQACGRELADLLQTTCHLGYNTYYENDSNGSREKRDVPKLGIYQECCLQACKLSDLLSYCYNGSSVPNSTVTGAHLSSIQPLNDSNKKDNDIKFVPKDNEITSTSRPKLFKNTLTTIKLPTERVKTTKNATLNTNAVLISPLYYMNRAAIVTGRWPDHHTNASERTAYSLSSKPN